MFVEILHLTDIILDHTTPCQKLRQYQRINLSKLVSFLAILQ